MATDQIGTPRILFDVEGQIIAVINRDSFGAKVRIQELAFYFPIGFAGGLEDNDTRLVRFGLRDYDLAVGCWMARDPVLFYGGQANLYAYVGNDPINLRDRSGLGLKQAKACRCSGGFSGAACSERRGRLLIFGVVLRHGCNFFLWGLGVAADRSFRTPTSSCLRQARSGLLI